MTATSVPVRLPAPRELVRHAGPTLIESMLGPLAVFYLVLELAGYRGAVVAALAWSLLALGRRVVQRRAVPGLLVVSIVLLAGRSALALATGSVVLYFAQPIAGTALSGLVFLGSAALRRPLLERLAVDFCPLDPALVATPFVRRFFLRLSVLWAAIMLANAGASAFFLVASSLRNFVLERTAASWGLTLLGVAVSTLWFARTLRHHDLHLVMPWARPARR